mgnify:CR=1 FL=1
MKELTCIGCPRGCTLKIERDGDDWSVTGNTCPRGKEFAISMSWTRSKPSPYQSVSAAAMS